MIMKIKTHICNDNEPDLHIRFGILHSLKLQVIRKSQSRLNGEADVQKRPECSRNPTCFVQKLLKPIVRLIIAWITPNSSVSSVSDMTYIYISVHLDLFLVALMALTILSKERFLNSDGGVIAVWALVSLLGGVKLRRASLDDGIMQNKNNTLRVKWQMMVQEQDKKSYLDPLYAQVAPLRRSQTRLRISYLTSE
jgi:hypothetical protein